MKLQFSPGAYESRNGFRPVVRISRDNRMIGNRAAPGELFADRESAIAFARNACADVVQWLESQSELQGVALRVS
jgi:hypothetical protein